MAAKRKKPSQTKSDNFIEQAINNIEERARKELEDLRGRVESGFEEVSRTTTARASKLESAFDKRVAQAYNRLGLPSKSDIDALEQKIDKLQRAVNDLKKQSGPAQKTARKATTKTTAKKTAKKSTSKSRRST